MALAEVLFTTEFEAWWDGLATEQTGGRGRQGQAPRGARSWIGLPAIVPLAERVYREYLEDSGQV